MNRFLTLAKKVLDDEGILSAREIWDRAKLHLPTDEPCGHSPAVAMALTLASECQKPGSEIHRVEGDPPAYCLKYVWLMTLPIEAAVAAAYAEADAIAQSSTLKQIASEATERGATIAARVQKHMNQGWASYRGRERNPFVIAGVRLRAGYRCELCGETGFAREDGKPPYVEVHHLVRLADGGPDTLENTAALCANCHRKIHFGGDRQELKMVLVSLRQSDISVVSAKQP